MIDHKPYTRMVDVYSFGIVLWEMCTGQWPFEGLSFVQLAQAIVVDVSRAAPLDSCVHVRPPLKDAPRQFH